MTVYYEFEQTRPGGSALLNWWKRRLGNAVTAERVDNAPGDAMGGPRLSLSHWNADQDGHLLDERWSPERLLEEREPEPVQSRHPHAEHLEYLVGLLHVETRLLLDLHDAGVPQEEIGERFGLTQASVSGRLSAIRARLARLAALPFVKEPMLREALQAVRIDGESADAIVEVVTTHCTQIAVARRIGRSLGWTRHQIEKAHGRLRKLGAFGEVVQVLGAALRDGGLVLEYQKKRLFPWVERRVPTQDSPVIDELVQKFRLIERAAQWEQRFLQTLDAMLEDETRLDEIEDDFGLEARALVEGGVLVQREEESRIVVDDRKPREASAPISLEDWAPPPTML